MQNDILSKMQLNAHRFSKGQRAIAKYITDSYDKAAFLTASKLGKTVGVSESTVVRFAMEMGYDGYPAMQKALQEIVVNRLTSVQRIGVANDRMGKQDVLNSVFQSDMEKLRQTAESVSREDFHAAVDKIVKARRVYVVGARSAAPLASFFGYYLNLMLDTVHILTGSGSSSTLEQLISINEEDVLVAFSFPRYSTSTADGAEFSRSRGATIIGITDAADSPLGRCSDYILLAKSNMISLVDSLTAPMSIVNALIVAIASQNRQRLDKRFAELEAFWEEYNVYKKQVK